VLGWNRRDDTVACLDSLAAQTAPGVTLRLTLVDNGSTDGTVEAVERALPAVGIVPLQRNLGFAGAANIGIGRALDTGADWTWLVNNDTLAMTGLLRELLAGAVREDVGLVTPTIRVLDRPELVWPSAGWRRRLTLAAFDTTASPPSPAPYDVDWATGCCLLVRAATWRRIGLLDDRYAFYFEDHDLCLRARAAGWRIVHVPRATVLHRVAGSTGAGSPRQMYLLARASVPFYWRHTRGLHRWFIVAYRLGSFMCTLARCLKAGRPAAAAAYARGLADGVTDLARAGGPPPDWDRYRVART